MRTLGFLLIAFAMVTFLGCTKEQMNANKLEGYWDVTECEFDGEDVLDLYDMTFLLLQYKDGEGEAVWTWEAVDGGPREMGVIFDGTWELNKEADELTMLLEYSSDMEVELIGDIELTKGEFELDGTIEMEGSEPMDVKLTAERRE